MAKAPTAMDEIIKAIGANDDQQDVKDWLSTGVLPLNQALSGRYAGGIPVGRITEIYGGESSGKTLMATMAMIETQKKGGVAVMLDYEHAFSVERAKNLGLQTDVSQWIYRQPVTAEDGFMALEKVCEIMHKMDPERHVTIVVDSTASMVTKAEMEAGFDNQNMKTQLSLAVCMARSLKMIAGIISRTNTTLIFLNQVRVNPGVMFGDNETTPGGKAMKFYATLRIRLHKKGKIKDGEEVVGEEVVARVIKNKVYKPFQECEYISSFETGIDLETTHVNHLIAIGLIPYANGYAEWEGKKRRQKELATMCRTDRETYARLLDLFGQGVSHVPAA